MKRFAIGCECSHQLMKALGQILKTLEAQGKLDNTLIVFTSDEGYFYGEHGLSVERRLAYEESARIPLYIRWPKLIKGWHNNQRSYTQY